MELGCLLDSLITTASKWEPLGLQFGLSASDLATIRANSKDVEECLRRVLGKWHDRTVRPTWEEVIAALKAPSVDEVRLADELSRKCVVAERRGENNVPGPTIHNIIV